ncbi:MAG TPA: serine kinase, partial [Candidatus Aminicenantes bacterium]|nr:serine kinase [Candidatus Aminicenantes bacterium]
MKLNKIKKDLNLKILTAKKFLDNEVKGGYTSDLLSDVMANSKEKYIWITLQVHLNIVAVAKLKEL